MAFVGPNTVFKKTTRKFRTKLRALGYTSVQMYNRMISFKLKQVTYNFTVTALSTATTPGTQYTSPNGIVFTVIDTVPVGATTMTMSARTSPDAAPSTLTLVANSSGTKGTAQSSISYSAVFTTPGSLGPYLTKES
jgi:hypothetical protein